MCQYLADSTNCIDHLCQNNGTCNSIKDQRKVRFSSLLYSFEILECVFEVYRKIETKDSSKSSYESTYNVIKIHYEYLYLIYSIEFCILSDVIASQDSMEHFVITQRMNDYAKKIIVCIEELHYGHWMQMRKELIAHANVNRSIRVNE